MIVRPSYWIAAAALAGVAAVGFLSGARLPIHVQHIKVYFEDAQGLREGAAVRLAGVEMGKVTSVRVRPEMREHPAEVVVMLRTTYDLKIPRDAKVMLRNNGILGETIADIDIRTASGPPVEDWGVLSAAASHVVPPEQALTSLFGHKPCDPAPTHPVENGTQDPKK